MIEIQLVCERSIQAFGNGEVLRRGMEHILFLQEQVVDCLSVDFASEQERLLFRPDLFDSPIFVIFRWFIVPFLILEVELDRVVCVWFLLL